MMSRDDHDARVAQRAPVEVTVPEASTLSIRAVRKEGGGDMGVCGGGWERCRRAVSEQVTRAQPHLVLRQPKSFRIMVRLNMFCKTRIRVAPTELLRLV